MFIKYDRGIKNGVIFYEIETTGFRANEIKALESLGEPEIHFEKIYGGKFPVSINKKIRTNFKKKLTFDGNENLQEAVRAANDFFDDIKECLAATMENLMEKFCDAEFESGSGTEEIKY